MSVRDKELRKKQAFLIGYRNADSVNRKDIEERVKAIPDKLASMILWHRYILQQPWDIVCEEVNYERTTVIRRHREGIELLEVPKEVMT